MITPEMFARAGSSHSRSSSSYSSHSSSSSSYSRPTKSYSRPAYTAPSRPAYTRPATPPPRAATPVARPQTVINRTTINRTTVNRSNDSGGGNYNNRNNNNNNDNGGNNNGGGGGMGIMGTIAGVGGGIVVGNLLTSALMGDHRNEGHAPAGGYASTPAGYPVAGQPVAPAMAGAETGNYVTDGKGGYIPAPVSTDSTTVPTEQPVISTSAPVVQPTPVIEEDHWIIRWVGYLFAGLILGTLIGLALKKYLTYRARQKEMQNMMEAEQNLTKFEQIFKTVQSSYEMGARVNLIKLCTPEMYDTIIQAKDGNEDQGLTNVIDDVQVHSLVNLSSWEEEGVKFQQVKIRFSMIDYMIDENGEVTHGSKDKRETAVEYWTFSSSSKNDWVLSSIKQHSGYVHQS